MKLRSSRRITRRSYFQACLLLVGSAFSLDANAPFAEESGSEAQHAGAAPAEAAGAEAPAAEAKRKPARDSNECLVDESAVEDLRRRREQLDERERAIAERERAFELQEKGLAEQVARLDALRAGIEREKELRRKESQEKVSKLVETFETMTPKTAAPILATLEETLAVEVMRRLSTQKLAKILNFVEPGRSARLTERLVGGSEDSNSKVRSEASNGVSETGPSGRRPSSEGGADGAVTPSAKGGE